jgi:hypothetical protein
VEPEVAAVPTPSLATEMAVSLDERIEAIEDEIVVVGMGIAVPGASDPAQFWHELPQGDERLNADGIPCPSAHDPRRNPHRKADGRQVATIRAILETRVTPAAGCGPVPPGRPARRPDRRRPGTVVRVKSSVPDTSAWRPAVW